MYLFFFLFPYWLHIFTHTIVINGWRKVSLSLSTLLSWSFFLSTLLSLLLSLSFFLCLLSLFLLCSQSVCFSLLCSLSLSLSLCFQYLLLIWEERVWGKKSINCILFIWWTFRLLYLHKSNIHLFISIYKEMNLASSSGGAVGGWLFFIFLLMKRKPIKSKKNL